MGINKYFQGGTTTSIRDPLKITILDRLLLLVMVLLAAWQIAFGIDHLSTLPILAYTIGFGILLVAGLLLIILGFEILDNPVVVIISTVIPLSLSLGMVWDHLAAYRSLYLSFSILGFLAIVATRFIPQKDKLPVIVLASVHGVAGMTIFLLPLVQAFTGRAAPCFALVSVGGALIGLLGVLLSFLKAGKPILPQKTILKILPGLLLLSTVAFVSGLFAS
jgi:hypothetical protein